MLRLLNEDACILASCSSLPLKRIEFTLKPLHGCMMFVAQRCRVKLNDKITFDEQLDLSSVANSMLDDSKTAAPTESTWPIRYAITVTGRALSVHLNGAFEAVTGAVCVAYFP